MDLLWFFGYTAFSLRRVVQLGLQVDRGQLGARRRSPKVIDVLGGRSSYDRLRQHSERRTVHSIGWLRPLPVTIRRGMRIGRCGSQLPEQERTQTPRRGTHLAAHAAVFVHPQNSSTNRLIGALDVS
jgi:hypothetical protein